MFYLDQPPRVIETRVFSSMPERFRQSGIGSAWANANKAGQSVDSFLEGPAFDAQGRLYVVDIPFGRIFRIDREGEWTLVAQYDGEPNGLKFHPDGRILIADYRNGIMQLDAQTGRVEPLLSSRNGESFKGCNDLAIAANGDIYFTDQGQTGLQDPSGRVYRLRADGRLDCLISNGVSPNGLVLDPSGRVLFVAMTRDNAVWRLPLLDNGGTAKAGNLYVAHASLGHVFVFAPNGACIARVKSCAGETVTNLAFGGPQRRQIFITESKSGSILVADTEHPGIALPRLL
jgi:gluconolactonase